MTVQLKDDEKVEILRQVLPQFWTEAVHWREDSWRFTTWLVSSLIIITGISVYTDRGLQFAALILLALSIGGTVYLWKNYRSYQNRLGYFLRIEEALLFFEKDAYIKGQSLLPKVILNNKITWLGQGAYIFIIWLVAGASLFSIYAQVQ
jgi:hypothetical protein